MADHSSLDAAGVRAANPCRTAEPCLRDGKPAASASDLLNSDVLGAVCRFYDAALRWHHEPPSTSATSDDIAEKALHLHAMNFGLWHQEDRVRRPNATDTDVARGKRCIDDLNARRNAAVEDIDAILVARLRPVQDNGAEIHTETPATIVDRLSVLTLRILHMDMDDRRGARLSILEEQYADLLDGLEQLLRRLERGEVRFKVYRQFKSDGQRGYCGLAEDRDY